MKRVLVGLSGGVDSAAAALFLREAGYEVVGAFFFFHPGADPSGARIVAEKLAIPLVEKDYIKTFRERVIADFIEQYKNGKTPNPCAYCNRFMKFAALCETADALGIRPVATGHYARVLQKNGRTQLFEGSDKKKDQSYFLWRLTQEQLSRIVLPLEGKHKSDIKQRVENAGVFSSEKKESQEICFIPGDDYSSFLESVEHFPANSVWKTGQFVDESGHVLGKHQGIIRYTMGQRKRLGIALGQRAFVKKVNAKTGDVTVSFEPPCQINCSIHSINFVSAPPFEGVCTCTVRTRYRTVPVGCNVRIQADRAEVVLDTPASVCPGQSAVFYEGDKLLFGGICE